MKTIFDFRPAGIIDLGDGTYLENSNIEEFTDEETGATQWRADSARKEWPKVPIEVYGFQLMTVLRRIDLLDTVEEMINQIEDVSQREEVLLAWNPGVKVKRDSPTLTLIAAQLEIPTQQVDDIFIEANQVKV